MCGVEFSSKQLVSSLPLVYHNNQRLILFEGMEGIGVYSLG
jgi:hypothetical protein